MEYEKFRYNGFVIEHKPLPSLDYLFALEVYMVDVYHTNMIKPNDIVLDLGAGNGDFAIKASRRAKQVIAVEPNKEDFQLLRRNLQANGCDNVVPLEIGVASEAGTRQITFLDRTYSFRVETLAEMLERQKISRVDYIKLDIEGYETEVIESSIDIIKQARVIALELHGTKKAIDTLLLPLGFKYVPLTKSYVYGKLLAQLIARPHVVLSAYKKLKRITPKIGSKMISGHGPDVVSKDSELVVGVYLR